GLCGLRRDLRWRRLEAMRPKRIALRILRTRPLQLLQIERLCALLLRAVGNNTRSLYRLRNAVRTRLRHLGQRAGPAYRYERQRERSDHEADAQFRADPHQLVPRNSVKRTRDSSSGASIASRLSVNSSSAADGTASSTSFTNPRTLV